MDPHLLANQQLLTKLGVSDQVYISNMRKQILQVQNIISRTDKSDLYNYSRTLDRLYLLQTKLASATSQEAQDVLAQRVQMLESLTSNLSSL